MDTDALVLHLFLTHVLGGSTVVFLLETEPGVVEFPRLAVAPGDLDDSDALVAHVREATGIEVEPSGYLTAPPGADLAPEGSRILLARVINGSPRVKLPHVGWEWTPAVELVRMPFAPKLMVEELKSFMNV